MAAAKHVVAQAEEDAEKTRKQLDRADFVIRESDRKVTTARALCDQLSARLSEVDGMLAGAESQEQLRARLKTVQARRQELAEATAAVRAARDTQKQAAAQAKAAEDKLRKAWRDFDSARDTVAALAPPAADREDLGKSWKALQTWATGEIEAGQQNLTRLRTDLQKAQEATAKQTEALDALFTKA